MPIRKWIKLILKEYDNLMRGYFNKQMITLIFLLTPVLVYLRVETPLASCVTTIFWNPSDFFKTTVTLKESIENL